MVVVSLSPSQYSLELVSRRDFLAEGGSDVCTVQHPQGEAEDLLLTAVRLTLRCGRTRIHLTHRHQMNDGTSVSTYRASSGYRLYMEHLNGCLESSEGKVLHRHLTMPWYQFEPDRIERAVQVEVWVAENESASLVSATLQDLGTCWGDGLALYDMYSRVNGSLLRTGQQMTFSEAVRLLSEDARYKYWAQKLIETYRPYSTTEQNG